MTTPQPLEALLHRSPGQNPQTGVHASCVAIGETGVLILGPSGSGKTTLALNLLDACQCLAKFGLLVSDDRTMVSTCSGRIIARPHPAIAGQYEQRGAGILQRRYEPSIVVRLAVWCMIGDGERLPEGVPEAWRHGQSIIPMLRVGRDHHRTRMVLQFLAHLDDSAGLSGSQD